MKTSSIEHMEGGLMKIILGNPVHNVISQFDGKPSGKRELKIAIDHYSRWFVEENSNDQNKISENRITDAAMIYQ